MNNLITEEWNELDVVPAEDEPMVRVVDPSGKPGYVPRGNLERATQRGFRSAERQPQAMGRRLQSLVAEGVYDDPEEEAKVGYEDAEMQPRKPRNEREAEIMDLEDEMADPEDRLNAKEYEELGERLDRLRNDAVKDNDRQGVQQWLMRGDKKAETNAKSPPPTKGRALRTRKPTKSEAEWLKKNPGKW